MEGPVVSYGTGQPLDRPEITITGTTDKAVILKIKCTSPGVRGQWTLQYSTDNWNTVYPDKITSLPSAVTIPINSSVDGTSTGLKLHIDDSIVLDKDTHKATVGDLWIADNTYDNSSDYDVGGHNIITIRNADTSSDSGNTSITWIETKTSSLLTVDGPCQNFSCTNCFFKGTDATTHQISAILIKGHTFDPFVYCRNIESQRVVKIIGNTFDTFDVDAIIYSRTWTTKEIKIQNNVFVDSPFSPMYCS